MASFEFTERVKKILTHIAKEEAYRLKNGYIGPEHLLLAIIREGTGVAVEIIQKLNIDLDEFAKEVESLIEISTYVNVLGEIRYTPRAHKIIDYGREESQLLGHIYMGTEHLLLGFIREGEGIPAKVLKSHGVALEIARIEVLRILGGDKMRLEESPKKRIIQPPIDSPPQKTKRLTKILFKVNGDIELRMLDYSYSRRLFSLIEDNRSYLREWLPWLDNNKTVEDSVEFRKRSLELFEKDMGLNLQIMYKNEITGAISFNTIDWQNRKATIGYWLSESNQGKGIMTESCKTLIDYAFKELQLNRVEIRCTEGNKKSRAIPERLGFKQEGIIRDGEWLYDHYVDLVVYGILSSEWSTSKQSQ